MNDDHSGRPELERALLEKLRSDPAAVAELRKRVAAAASRPARASTDSPGESQHEPIAIIGMAARFPGSPDVRTFWRRIAGGEELIGEIPAARRRFGNGDRVPADRYRRAGLIDRIEEFESELFAITPREAAGMDPHQRVFLETVWQALEDSGYSPHSFSGSRTGVFAAMYNHEFIAGAGAGQQIDAFSATGAADFMVANRISYAFGLCGPSETVNTACSSSLVAVHRAVRALRGGECDVAIAGGVSLLLTLDRLRVLDQFGILSPEGRCRPFDRKTTGQVIGEGAGAILLKRLSAARRDGDFIHAIILGSAVNHAGNRSGSPTMPDAVSQASVMRDACADARIPVDSIGYIEAHGAGGHGDVVELSAFMRARGEGARSGAAVPPRCGVGTVKPNIGFLEAAGGASQIVKAVLTLRHGTLVPTLNHDSCPEEIAIERSAFEIVTRGRTWERSTDANGEPIPRRAGVHSYGLGGTNAHIVLQEWNGEDARRPDGEAVVLPLSAAAPEALRESALALVAFLRSDEGVRTVLSDLGFTLQSGRAVFSHRVAVVAQSHAEAGRRLEAWLRGEVYSQATPPSDSQPWELARLWIDGEAVDWTPLHRGRERRRVSAPVYPFASLSQRTESDEKAVAWSIAASDPRVGDHRIYGSPIIPATVLLDAVLESAPQAGIADTLRFEDAFWLDPCVVSHDWRDLTIHWSRTEDRSHFFRIESEQDGVTVVHGTGHAKSDADGAVTVPEVASLLGYAAAHMTEPYRDNGSAGFNFGPAFRTIREAWVIDDSTVVGRVALNVRSIPAAAGRLDPLLLDAAFQVASFLAAHRGEGVYLPYSAESIFVGRTGQNEEGWVCTRLISRTDDDVRCDVVVFRDAEVLASVSGLCLRRLHAEQMQAVTILERLSRGEIGVDEAAVQLGLGDGEAPPPKPQASEAESGVPGRPW